MERIFDIGAFTILLFWPRFSPSAPERLPWPASRRPRPLAGDGAIAKPSGEALARWVERRFAHLASNLGHRIALRIREFHGGLDTIHNAWSFVMLAVVSIAMWAVMPPALRAGKA